MTCVFVHQYLCYRRLVALVVFEKACILRLRKIKEELNLWLCLGSCNSSSFTWVYLWDYLWGDWLPNTWGSTWDLTWDYHSKVSPVESKQPNDEKEVKDAGGEKDEKDEKEDQEDTKARSMVSCDSEKCFELDVLFVDFWITVRIYRPVAVSCSQCHWKWRRKLLRLVMMS